MYCRGKATPRAGRQNLLRVRQIVPLKGPGLPGTAARESTGASLTRAQITEVLERVPHAPLRELLERLAIDRVGRELERRTEEA